MSQNFVTWLSDKLEEQGWSMRELGRRANISYTSVANVMSGQRRPTWDFCAAVARPLGESPINIFRIAGLMDELPKNDITYQELVQILEGLTEEERLEVIRYAKYLMRRG